MDESNAIILSSLLSSANLALSAYCLWRAFKRKLSPMLLFWLTSIYLVGFPLFVDSMATQFGYRETWVEMLGSFNKSYQYDWPPLSIARTTLFVFIFNLLFAFTAGVCFRLGRRWTLTMDTAYFKSAATPFLTLFLPCALGWVGLILFFALNVPTMSGTFGNIMIMTYTSFLTLSGIAAFYSTRDKKYLFLVITLLPTAILASYSGQRPYIVPPLLAAFYGFIVSQERIRLHSLMKAAFFCTIIIFSFLCVRYGFDKTMDMFFGNMPYPVDRDVSSDILYYCFSDKGLYKDAGTSYTGISRLAMTGLRPRVLFDEDSGDIDVTRYIAVKRHKWEYGTLHPTLFGWFYVDMKWWGLLVAIPLAIGLAILEIVSSKSLFLRIVIVTTTAMFIVVAMRGSVQYAYSRSIYAAAIGVFLFFLSWLMSSGSTKRARMPYSPATRGGNICVMPFSPAKKIV